MFFETSRIAASAVVRFAVAALAILLVPAIAEAGAVEIDEEEVNKIFQQENFGDTRISIRFNPSQTIVAPQLLVINTPEDYQMLSSLVPDPGLTVVAFFVDILNACVESLYEFFGCAEKPGNFQTLNSTVAAVYPSELIAHELGHNLGLEHAHIGLMYFFLGAGPDLSTDQVADILKSPLVQIDANGQRFIQVTPIAIVGTPEPSTLLLLTASIGVMFIIKKRIV